ncbi:uncharacterized protein LOC127446544 [Myxocyprinus asiaticus]|uniref:uncharacterized protein LOC127446544 n=1 Tax=Myxocyprinus asiaticus TaxID=70543 RepID=UPI0022223DD2|nr:uncharacterized protein LOC127446544 [Myxocyprinus asiaticus]
MTEGRAQHGRCAISNMWIILNILLSLYHVTTACTQSYSGVTEKKAYAGESVLLPCTCTDPQDMPKSISWETNSRRASKDHLYTDIFSVFELYSNRITLFNETSPGNLSLLLSGLTKEDQGWYICWLDKTSRFINVSVEEGTQIFSKAHLSIFISLLLIAITLVGAAVIFWIHRGHRNAKIETGEKNVGNNLGDNDSTYCTLQRKYDAEEMYGTIGKTTKDQ